MQEILENISQQLQAGRAKDVVVLVQEAVDAGIPASQILDEGLLSGMAVIGERFKNNEVFVPEVLVAARAMNKGTEVLRPLLAEAGVKSRGVGVIGTVRGDLHDIGKNLVRMMMEGRGLQMIDLGVDVPPERFLEAARENNAQLICCSALLTTTMGEMRSVVDLVKASDIAGSVHVMIGGAPVTQAFCDQIGADCYTPDAASAADAALAYCTPA